MTIYCVTFLVFIKILGYKLVWTAHDLIPHGDYFVNNSFVTGILSRLSDAIIVHSKYSLKPMARLGIDIKKVHILRIGNYIGLYPNTLSKYDARKKLSLKKNDIVFGMFGKIEKYKGVVDLIEKFNLIKLQNSMLIIVGICPDVDLKRQIIKLSKANNNIKLFLSFIDDNDVQTYINSSDILVYPFNNINTSSSIILSMSFRKPVICPRMGDLVELPANTGIYYKISDKFGLQNSLKDAFKQKYHLEEMGANAYKYVSLLNWSDIAKSTLNIYKLLLKQ